MLYDSAQGEWKCAGREHTDNTARMFLHTAKYSTQIQQAQQASRGK
jgi:hypothetical protein